MLPVLLQSRTGVSGRNSGSDRCFQEDLSSVYIKGADIVACHKKIDPRNQGIDLEISCNLRNLFKFEEIFQRMLCEIYNL